MLQFIFYKQDLLTILVMLSCSQQQSKHLNSFSFIGSRFLPPPSIQFVKKKTEYETERDIVHGNAGAVLAADIMPTLIVKATAPFWTHKIPYPVRITLVCHFFK